MGFFKDVGKFLGGIASVVVPGFSALAKTGIMGDTLAAFNGAPQSSAIQQIVASDPALLANTVAAPRPLESPTYIPPSPSAVFAPPLSGRTVVMPVEYVQALAGAARGAGSPAVPSRVPGGVVTPLDALRRQLPTTGIAPNITPMFNWTQL